MSIRHERKDAMENRQLILQTANQLFHEHGVQSVSMHQIAKTAGIGQATLYRRYAHKGDLCFDVLQHYGRQFIQEITEYLDKHKQAAPIDRLSGILGFWIDAIETNAELIVEMSSKMNFNCDDNQSNFFLSPMYRTIRDQLSELIQETIETDPEQQPEPDLAAHTIICSISPIGYFHIKNEKNYTKEHMKEHYRRLCVLFFKKA
ncbi:TetR/AcrR family transcriptional regulator [Paenibacillus qinlingensis]|uniref:AcrR family transcriptional regulator n=1 Tax=Paenibacillus qinlingensis TaxID=1837343 RepID=A0ABU1P582_9BACL|nr:TetR/AcrR family transcriptional regulator [Paenibacillus qinlingensis]MDR6554372.1 AcrR family transcriptional regulator [Paenibacillus qinlingensis]